MLQARSISLNAMTGWCMLMAMSTVQEIESAITKLKLEEMEAVREWLEDFIEDQLEVSDEYKGKVQRAKDEIASGTHSRVRQPDGEA